MPRDCVVEGVATATTFALAFVFVNIHTRGVDAFSIVLCDVVVVLVRIIHDRSRNHPVLGKIAVASEDEDMCIASCRPKCVARGSHVALRSSCANSNSVLADALRARKGLKVDRHRPSFRPRCCRGCWPSSG